MRLKALQLLAMRLKPLQLLAMRLKVLQLLVMRLKEMHFLLTRVNSTNVLNEGLRIGEIGRRMNSKVKLVEIGVCQK
jgi:hypothetical protein